MEILIKRFPVWPSSKVKMCYIMKPFFKDRVRHKIRGGVKHRVGLHIVWMVQEYLAVKLSFRFLNLF